METGPGVDHPCKALWQLAKSRPSKKSYGWAFVRTVAATLLDKIDACNTVLCIMVSQNHNTKLSLVLHCIYCHVLVPLKIISLSYTSDACLTIQPEELLTQLQNDYKKHIIKAVRIHTFFVV